MDTFSILARYKVRLWAAAIFDSGRAAMIRNVSTGIMLVALVFSAYVFFYDFIFRYVARLEDLGFLLIDRLVSTGFLAFFVMLVISGFIAAIATMFRSDETEYILSTPVSEMELFASKFVDTVVYSSWAILVMALPILAAYARIMNFGLREYLLAGLFVLVPFVLTASSIGTILALIATAASRRMSMKNLIISGALTFGALIYVFVTYSRPTDLRIPFHEDFRGLNLFINNFNINSNPFTPNYWVVESLRALERNRYVEFLVYESALLSTAFFACMTAFFLGKRFFFPAWSASLEERIGRSQDNRKVHARTLLTIAPSGKLTHALFEKECVVFLRDPSQWAQILLLLSLLVVYFLNIRLVPADIEIEKWRAIIAMMNFGFSGFVLATLAVRFIFPSFSLDGRAFWVIAASPVPLSTLFRVKFLTAFTGFILIAEPAAVLSGLLLNLGGVYLFTTIAGIFLMSVTLASIAVGFGATFPVFDERDPSRIASSPGGILTIVVSLIYVGAMTALCAIPLSAYTAYLVSGFRFPGLLITICLVAMAVLNVILIALPLMLGLRSLSRREY